MDATLNLLRQIILNLPNFIFWKDTHLIYRGCNKRFANSLGFDDVHDLIGCSDFDMPWDEASAAIYIEEDHFILNTGQPILNKEVPMQFPSGEHLMLSISKVPLYDEQNNISGILGIYIDITELKRKEEALSLAKEKAELASEAKSKFIANMSHDLRTPLTGVVGMSELLQEQITNHEQAQFAHYIHDSGKQLLGLLNDILDIVSLDTSQEERINATSFDLYQCIDDLVQLELPTIKLKNLDLSVHIDKKIPQYVYSDRIKIHRVLLNLVGNAIKFTQSGLITIKLELMEQKAATARIHFSVSDTGIGIPEDELANIFDRFHRVNPSQEGVYKGYGVGLHIAQTYVKLLSGEIHVVSKPNVGTTFHFELPLVISSPPIESNTFVHPNSRAGEIKKETNINQWAKHPSHLPRVLLIEDNFIALKTLETMVEQAACHFISFENAENAYAWLKDHDCDLIITDVGLPGLSGLELTEQIRQWELSHSRPKIPIIGLTAHAKQEAYQECLQKGMNDVYSKPLNKQGLEILLNTYIPNHHRKNSIEGQKTKKNNGLPHKTEDLFDLSTFPLLDIEEAINLLGSEEMVRAILPLMLTEETKDDFIALEVAYEEQNWSRIQTLAHKIKAGALNCGARRLQHACLYLERYQKAGYTEALDRLYLQLKEVFQETERHISQWLKA